MGTKSLDYNRRAKINCIRTINYVQRKNQSFLGNKKYREDWSNRTSGGALVLIVANRGLIPGTTYGPQRALPGVVYE